MASMSPSRPRPYLIPPRPIRNGWDTRRRPETTPQLQTARAYSLPATTGTYIVATGNNQALRLQYKFARPTEVGGYAIRGWVAILLRQLGVLVYDEAQLFEARRTAPSGNLDKRQVAVAIIVFSMGVDSRTGGAVTAPK